MTDIEQPATTSGEAEQTATPTPVAPSSRKSVKDRLGVKVREAESVEEVPKEEAEEEMAEEEEGEGEGSRGGSGLPERCRYWPNCKNGEGCEYHHPTVPCKLFPDCKYGKKCLYVHPQCKYNSRSVGHAWCWHGFCNVWDCVQALLVGWLLVLPSLYSYLVHDMKISNASNTVEVEAINVMRTCSHSMEFLSKLCLVL